MSALDAAEAAVLAPLMEKSPGGPRMLFGALASSGEGLRRDEESSTGSSLGGDEGSSGLAKGADHLDTRAGRGRGLSLL